MLGIIGIFLGIALIGFGAFRGWDSLPLSLAAVLVVALTNGLDIWKTYTETYLGGYTNTFVLYFLIFCTTCLYSKMMTESGNATAMAYKFLDWFGEKRVMTACCVVAAVLTYAGISAFVLSYVMVPIMWALFKEADIPRKLTICPVMFGCGTFVLACVPGSTEMTNLNPSLVLGTPLTAAPVMGSLGAIFLITTGLLYSNRQVRLAKERGEHFALPADVDPNQYSIDRDQLPPAWKGFVPTLLLCVCIIVGSRFISDAKLIIVCTMCVCILVCYALNFQTFRKKKMPAVISSGLENAVTVVASLAAVLGFAGVVQTTPGFQSLLDGLMNLDLPVYVKVSLYTALVSATLGSSASGSRVAISSLSDYILSSGANLEVVHRLTSMASVTVDSLPHCAAAFAQFKVLRITRNESYKYMFHLTVVQTSIACILATIAALIFY